MRTVLTLFLVLATLCAHAQSLHFDSEVLRLPDLLEGDTARHRMVFRCTNTGTQAVNITRVHASCGCTKVKQHPRSIAPGHRDSVVVEYRTLRRGIGTVDEPLYVYGPDSTMLATLHVTGNIAESPDSRWMHLPASMGPLRLKRKTLRFGPADRVLRLPCANTGSVLLRIRTMLLPPGITVFTEPQVILPDDEADIVVRIDRSLVKSKNCVIILDGIPCDVRQRQISVTIQ